MKGVRIKQINNLVIYQDVAEKVNYFGDLKDNPNYGKCSVWTPDGRCWEDGLSLEQAESFCRETKDFVRRDNAVNSVDLLIANATAAAKEANQGKTSVEQDFVKE